jgi:protein-S-isoprenylcysteine O-methyltransferase Ste14
MNQRNIHWQSHLLVALQFLSILFGIYPFGTPQGSLWWLAVSALGVLVGVWTLLHNRVGNFGVYPEPIADAQLVTSGPYRWVRHPMYLSLLLFMIGAALYNGRLLNLLSLVTLLIAIVGKMNREERYLHTRFGDYAIYSGNNKRLIPFIY